MPELDQMRAVDAIVQTIVSSSDDIVYISGSLIEGFGNRASDIDVFLVTAEEPQYRGPFGSVLGEYYLDLEVYRRDHMLGLSDRLKALDAGNFRAVWLTPLADLDLYYRTLIGQANHNAEAFEELRGGFSREVVARLLAAWCGLRHAAALQHAREELAAGRTMNAALAGQAAAAYALDSYLAANGEAFPSLKWRLEKVARLHGLESELYRQAWAIKAAGTKQPAAYLDEVERFAGELGMGAYADWSLDDVPLQKIGTSTSHDVAGEAYIVQNRRFVYGANDDLRAVFDLIDEVGPTRQTLVEEVRRAGASQADASSVVRGSIAALQGRGLLRAY